MQWYYANGGQRQGPISQADFDQLVRSGQIKGSTLVWQQGMPNWVPYETLSGGAASAAGADPDTEVCAVSGKRYPRREMIQYEGKWISAEHRDEFFQRLREGVAVPGGAAVPGPFGYGGFWLRFVARFVDGIILGVVGMVTGMIIGFAFGAAGALRGGDKAMFLLMQVVVQGVSIAIGILYEVLFVRKYDATPGKMVLGLKILRPTGEKLSAARIVGRYFAQWLSTLPLLFGYIMAGFDDEKRALHDRVCDTRVIRTRA